MRTFHHPDQMLHHPRSYFSRGRMREPQEVPARAEALLAAVQALGFPVAAPPDAGPEPILAVHGSDYLRFLQDAHAAWTALGPDWGEEVVSNVFVREPNALRGVLAQAARYLADGSAPVGPQTYRSAYASAQGALAGADALRAGAREAYALCRPPGHHARAEAAGGFCYLNNAAVAAERLRATWPRVAILDTDMHHGQGIQEIFYDRADVFYVSIHGDPTNFYPAVAGHADERGAGAGAGCNLNLPMPHGSDEAAFFACLAQALRALDRYRPDALVLCLGFDVYAGDPQAKVAVGAEGFGRLGREIGRFGAPTLIVQEGGYCLEALTDLSRRFFEGFLSARS